MLPSKWQVFIISLVYLDGSISILKIFLITLGQIQKTLTKIFIVHVDCAFIRSISLLLTIKLKLLYRLSINTLSIGYIRVNYYKVAFILFSDKSYHSTSAFCSWPFITSLNSSSEQDSSCIKYCIVNSLFESYLD